MRRGCLSRCRDHAFSRFSPVGSCRPLAENLTLGMFACQGHLSPSAPLLPASWLLLWIGGFGFPGVRPPPDSRPASGFLTVGGVPGALVTPFVTSDPVLRQTPRPAGTWGALGPSGGDWTVRGRGTGAPPLSTCPLCSLLRPTGKLSFLSPTLPQCRLLREVLLRPAGRPEGPGAPGTGFRPVGFSTLCLIRSRRPFWKIESLQAETTAQACCAPGAWHRAELSTWANAEENVADSLSLTGLGRRSGGRDPRLLQGPFPRAQPSPATPGRGGAGRRGSDGPAEQPW